MPLIKDMSEDSLASLETKQERDTEFEGGYHNMMLKC